MAIKGTGISARVLIAAAVGLGSYWAWMNLQAANATAFPWLAESIYPPQQLLSSSAYLVALAFLFFFGTHPWVKGHRRLLAALGAAFAVVGSLATAAGTVLSVNALLAVGIVTSFGTAVLLVLWGSFFSSFEPRPVALMTTASFAFGAFTYLALSEFLGAALVYALPLLLLLYGLLLLYVEGYAEGGRPSDADEAARPAPSLPVSSRGALVVLGCLVVCVILNEMLRIISTPLAADGFTRVGSFTQFGGLLVSVAALLAVRFSRRPFSFNTMAIVVVPLMVAGFLSFLVFADSGSFTMFILLGAGYWCLNMLVWVALCDAVRRAGVSPVRTFALFYGIIQLAILAAKPVGDWVLQHLSVTSSGLSLIVSVSVLAVVVAAMLLLRDRSVAPLLGASASAASAEGLVSTAHGAFRGAGNPRDATASFDGTASGDAAESAPAGEAPDRFSPEWLTGIAERYALTPRETEVFLLLARGRSLPVIREELSIATGTAQTHIRHIYEKLSIHSRQELFDLIEQEASQA